MDALRKAVTATVITCGSLTYLIVELAPPSAKH